MDRYWLLTSTFYGNWLPGDPRGFVARVRDRRPGEPPSATRREHDRPGTPYDQGLAGLHRAAGESLRDEPVRIDREQAEALLNQFRETAAVRGWRLVATAILANHVHWVVGVAGDPDPTKVLGDFKAYGSRALSRRWGSPSGGTWWTYSGSKRELEGEPNVHAAVAYVRAQEFPLVIRIAPEFVRPS